MNTSASDVLAKTQKRKRKEAKALLHSPIYRRLNMLSLTVKIHPVVLFQIVDAYERRNADSHRVIGTLLGELCEYSTWKFDLLMKEKIFSRLQALWKKASLK